MSSCVEEIRFPGRKCLGIELRFLFIALPLILTACIPAPLGKYYKPIYADPSASYSGNSCGGKAGAPAALTVNLPQGVVLSVNAWRSHGERDQTDRPLHLSIAVPEGVHLQFTSDEVHFGTGTAGAIRVTKPLLQVFASLMVPADTFVDFQKIAPTSFAVNDGRRVETDFSGSASFNFSWKDSFMPDAVRLVLPGIETDGASGTKHGPIMLNASAKKRPDSYPGQYKPSTSLIYATKESQQELTRRFEACTRETPNLKCNQILFFDEARFSAEQEGYSYSGRMYVFDVENHSPFSAEMTVKFSEPRTWRFATNNIGVIEASKNDSRSYSFDEFPLSISYQVPLETRITGVNNMPSGGQTMVGFSLNLGDREPSKYIIELPAVHINGVVYRFLPMELERRMFEVGIEPFNC